MCSTSELRVKPGLNSLLNALQEAKEKGITEIFLENGVHTIEDYYDEDYEKEVNIVNINIPISIVGESREHCIVMGGLKMNGKKEDDVNVSNLTLRGSKGNGVFGDNGASFHLDNVSVENSSSGVVVCGTKRSTMKNCNVSHSKRSGLAVRGGGLMTIDGNGTTIHHNCTDRNSRYYGLRTYGSSSSIHLASSLTIETISKNNGGGGNHGGNGTIQTITENYGKPFKVEDSSIGTNIFARWKINGTFYPGNITNINTDGTYDIKFTDGDVRKNTPLNEMQYN